MPARGSLLLAATVVVALVALAVACGDLKEAATGAVDADVADGPNGPPDATIGDGGPPTADASDGSSTDAGDPCATNYPDAGEIGRAHV